MLIFFVPPSFCNKSLFLGCLCLNQWRQLLASGTFETIVVLRIIWDNCRPRKHLRQVYACATFETSVCLCNIWDNCRHLTCRGVECRCRAISYGKFSVNVTCSRRKNRQIILFILRYTITKNIKFYVSVKKYLHKRIWIIMCFYTSFTANERNVVTHGHINSWYVRYLLNFESITY